MYRKLFAFTGFLLIIVYFARPADFVDYPRSNRTHAHAEVKSITSVLEIFRAENYKLPETNEGLGALVNNPDIENIETTGNILKKYLLTRGETPIITLKPKIVLRFLVLVVMVKVAVKMKLEIFS
jgi:hypothetical protein